MKDEACKFVFVVPTAGGVGKSVWTEALLALEPFATRDPVALETSVRNRVGPSAKT
jgi:hypothetical protein